MNSRPPAADWEEEGFLSPLLPQEPGAAVRFSSPGPALCRETIRSLQRLDRLSGGRLLETLVGKFLQESRRGVRALSTCLAEARDADFRAEVHLLKGSCQVLGALRMDRLCQRLLDLEPGAVATRSGLVAELALAFEEVHRSLWNLPQAESL